MAAVLVPVYKGAAQEGQVPLPPIFGAPVRPDVIRSVHTRVAKNARQAYAVNINAGMQHSAKSWGTGRAKARIPRVAASGTGRGSQGAFGNMCRKGRMFAPTKVWRKWHSKVSRGERRYAVQSAVAGSGVAALVMARGHRIANVPQVPLVVADSIQSIKKTKELLATLAAVNAFEDVKKVKDTKKDRAGKGKMRGRLYRTRRGPLIVYAESKGLRGAAANIGVDTCCVNALNLLQLAPGGHVGRFVVWTESAFKKLAEIYSKTPAAVMSNPDLSALLRSESVQAALIPRRKPAVFGARNHGNPLTNLKLRHKLNPYHSAALHGIRSVAANSKKDNKYTQGKKAALKKHQLKATRTLPH